MLSGICTLLEMRVRLCHKIPVSVGPEIERPLSWCKHFGEIFAPACFDQQNTHAGILSKSARERATGRSRATDNEIVTLRDLRSLTTE